MIEKDTNLMNGKGEWDESEHPRDSDGKFASKGGQSTSNQGKTKSQSTKKDAIKHLVETLKKIKNIKVKEIHSFIKSLDPVSLQINGDEIIAEFDKFTADKNLYGHGKSDKDGYAYKLNNPDKLPEMIKQSQYSHSKPEEGKKTPAHAGVKQWHYFKKDYKDFNVVVNVRDKGNRQFVYEVILKKKKV